MGRIILKKRCISSKECIPSKAYIDITNLSRSSILQNWGIAGIQGAEFQVDLWNAAKSRIAVDAEMQRIVPVNVKKPTGQGTSLIVTVMLQELLSLRQRSKNSFLKNDNYILF